eukprot:2487923-Rhodomonas_salina.1
MRVSQGSVSLPRDASYQSGRVLLLFPDVDQSLPERHDPAERNRPQPCDLCGTKRRRSHPRAQRALSVPNSVVSTNSFSPAGCTRIRRLRQ